MLVMKSFASALGVRGFLAIGLALLVAAAGWRIHQLKGEVSELTAWQSGVVSETNDAMGLPPGKLEAGDVVPSLKVLRQTREAAAAMVQQGAERSARAATALRGAQDQAARYQRQAERIRNAAPATDCRTPREVLEADL